MARGLTFSRAPFSRGPRLHLGPGHFLALLAAGVRVSFFLSLSLSLARSPSRLLFHPTFPALFLAATTLVGVASPSFYPQTPVSPLPPFRRRWFRLLHLCEFLLTRVYHPSNRDRKLSRVSRVLAFLYFCVPSLPPSFSLVFSLRRARHVVSSVASASVSRDITSMRFATRLQRFRLFSLLSLSLSKNNSCCPPVIFHAAEYIARDITLSSVRAR